MNAVNPCMNDVVRPVPPVASPRVTEIQCGWLERRIHDR